MKKIISVLAILLLSSSILDFAPPIMAISSPTVEWKGWTIGGYTETVGFVGDIVVAHIRMNAEPPGHYRIRIMRDIELWPDQEMNSMEFDYTGSDNTYDLSFTPTIPTGQDNTTGYHTDVYKKALLEWDETWTMLDQYPPRLKVIGWSVYHSYADVESGLRSLERGIAKVQSIGVSVEGRQIWAIKISDDPNTNDPSKPDILFVGCHHAAEWISVEVPLYIAANLVQRYTTDTSTRTLIDNAEIWIVPVLNPDGFEYSRSNPINRFWRKNRRDNGDGTFGVDINRNYGYQWGLDTDTSGTSGSSWAPDYRGPIEFSEPETRAMRDLISSPSNEFKALITYHSFSQLVLYPWGYTNEPAPDSGQMNVLAKNMAELVHSVQGAGYTVKQASRLYLASGDLTDWAYGTKRIPSFTIELRPLYEPPGFFLPTDQILPTCEENWPAAVYLARTRALDDTAPITTIVLGSPKYVSTLNYIFPETPIALEALDIGSNVNTTYFRIVDSTTTDNWQTYNSPFNLSTLTFGEYTIQFCSVDNLGNEETIHSQTVQLQANRDLNGDGVINMKDILIAAAAFGSRNGEVRWNPKADMNRDDKIDLFDFVIIAKDSGKQLS
jgi:murein tripeptide amidase MpaA